MADTPSDEGRRVRAHTPPAATPWLRLDLARELDDLARELDGRTGHKARTLAKHDDLRVVVIALRAGARIPEHKTDGRVAIQTVRGHLRVRAQGQIVDLPAGSVLALDRGLPHDVEAVEDSGLLLTIAWPGPR